MKRYLLFCQLALLSIFQARGQVIFSTGASPNGFHIETNTDVYIYGLTLRPSTDLDLLSKTLEISSTAAPLTPPSITRVYVFNDAFSFTGRVGLFYQTSELNSNTETALQVAYAATSYTVTTGSVVNTTTHYIYNDLGSSVSFSRVTAATEGALPVTLVDFKARKEGEIAHLYWQTSAETNSDHFEVQRSTNGKNWTALGKVNAWNESNSLRNYFYDDAEPAPGINYYRLKMVDRSGQFANSSIESLRFEDRTTASLYPNPVAEKLKIRVDDWAKIDAIKLLNTQGQTFFESGNGLSNREIDMKNFPSGTYLVQLTRTNGSVSVLKVVKY